MGQQSSEWNDNTTKHGQSGSHDHAERGLHAHDTGTPSSATRDTGRVRHLTSSLAMGHELHTAPRGWRNTLVWQRHHWRRAHLSSRALVSRQVQSSVVDVLQPLTTALSAASTGVQHAVRLHCTLQQDVDVRL